MSAALRFPDGFLWGAATSAHQTEGSNVASDWWELEHTPGTGIAEPSGDAADSYHRFGEDIRLLAETGLGSYRFGPEWARVEPERGSFSRAQVQHYRRMVETCLEAGIEPVVTLVNFTVPRWFRHAGFWRSADAADRFVRFVEAVVPVVGSDVRFCFTLNEPNIAAMLAGGEDGVTLTANGLPAPDPLVADTLVEAHRRAREVLSPIEGLATGWTIATQAFRSSGEPGAERTLREYGHPREGWWLERSRGDDVLGVQAYTRTVVGPEGPRDPAPGVPTTLTGWEVYPPAVGEGLRTAWEVSEHVPLMVTENGIATADDEERIAYTRGALQAVHEAIADGVEVLGYQHWTLLDNVEWASGRGPTFGLVAVDRETFARTPKPSAAWLGGVARENALPAQPVSGSV